MLVSNDGVIGMLTLVRMNRRVYLAERVGLRGVPPRPFGAALRVLAPPRLVPSDHLGTRHNASLSTYPTGVIPPFALNRRISGYGA
jgi:hypothetical protein